MTSSKSSIATESGTDGAPATFHDASAKPEWLICTRRGRKRLSGHAGFGLASRMMDGVAMRLRCGGYQGEASVHTRGLRALAAALEPSGVTVEITPNITEQGRKATDLFAMVEQGELDLCYFSSSYLGDRVPALRALDLPFLIQDRTHAYRLLDGTLGQRLSDAISRATGYRVLGFWDNGFRHITNRVRPIRAPADCAGLRIRTLDSALHQEVFRALGFEPVAIDVKDLKRAVVGGTVDAQENPLTNTVNFDLHRSHRHVSLTAHFFGVALLLANRASVDRWPAATRRAILQAATAATVTQRGLAAAEDATCLATLQDDGCAIVTPDELDLAGFDAAVAPIRTRVLADVDPAIARAIAGDT
jgi:TRAP-type C4-dicarboxylate transport system substrate-binding protein